jgi:hypothetical protein
MLLTASSGSAIALPRRPGTASYFSLLQSRTE